MHKEILREEGHDVTVLRLYSPEDEKVMIEICPAYYTEDGNVFWDRYDSLRVYHTDSVRLLYPVFDRLFPVTDPDPNGWGVQDSFDPTAPNWLGREDMLKLAALIKERCSSADTAEKEFYGEVLGFIEDSAYISEIFCIYGNL